MAERSLRNDLSGQANPENSNFSLSENGDRLVCSGSSSDGIAGAGRRTTGTTTATEASASGATTASALTTTASIAASTSGATSATATTVSGTGLSSLLLLELLKLLVELDEGRLDEVGSGPHIGGKKSIGLLKSPEGSEGVVLSSSGLTSARGVHILESRELANLLGNLGGDDTGTSGGRDHSNGTGTGLSLNLGGNGMDTTDSGAPIASSDGDDVHLGGDESALNGNLDFLADLDTDTNVTLSITASDDSLESGSLTSLGLLLDGKDAHDLVGELGLVVSEKSLNDGGFLDGDGVSVNLLEGSDVAVLNESTELGEGSPLLSGTAAAEAATGTTSTTTTTGASATSLATSTGATAAATTTEASLTTAGSSGSGNICRS